MFNWINFIIYAIITSITPGPNNIMSMTNGKTVGIKKSLPFCFGVGIGVFIILLLSAWIAGTISSFLPKISFPMRVLGCIYMLYLAFKTFTASSEIKENHKKTNVFIGIILQFINPKTYLYCIVSMELYVLPFYYDNPLFISLFALLLAFFAVICTIFWSAFGKVFTVLFSKHARTTNTIMSLLLVYCAISLFL